jgi:hypothetical protein
MDLDVLLAALVLAVLPALGRQERRAPSLLSDSGGMSRVGVGLSHWPRWRAGLNEFWNQQLHLHQLYLSSFDVSGGDALDAVARRNRQPRD